MALAVALAAVAAVALAASRSSPFRHSKPLPCVNHALLELRGSFTVNASSSAFTNVTDIDNQRCRVQPLVVVFPESEADVGLALAAAQRCKLRFSVISGGHGAAGFELAGAGLTVSMARMASVSVDTATGVMEVQPGARFEHIYQAVVASPQWIPVGGGCPQVAPGGYYLGGGWSFMSRSYGLGCDSMLAVTLVLANGTVVEANSSTACTSSPWCRDLWWASCGGGGGNFGVATRYTVQLQRAPKAILIGQLCWPADVAQLGEIWQWLLDSYNTMPNWLQIDPGWLPVGPNHTRMFCYTVICNHNDESACRKMIQPVTNRSDVALNTLKMRSYLSWQLEHGSVTAAQHGFLYLTNFMFEDGIVSASVMKRIQNEILAAPSPRNIVIFHMGGGRIADFEPSATAFPYRNAQFVLQVKAIWSIDSPQVSGENMAWVANLKSWLAPLANGSYVNYMDPLLDNWEAMYYGDNLRRLRAIKKAVDPMNVFVFNQSIRVARANYS